MSEIVLQLMPALGAGLALGLVYFGGLYWTVRRLPTSANPGLLALGSFLGRMALCLAGLWAVSLGDWRRMLACLGGVALARLVLVRRLGSPGPAAGWPWA